jgi:galactonate dehydratase
VYPVRPIDAVERRDRVREIELELKSWREEAATFIEFDERVLHTYLMTIQSRAQQLALANVEILLYRAYLLDDIEYYTQNSFVRLFGADWDKEAAEKVEKCLDAALRTTDMIDEFSRTVRNFNASWVLILHS